MLALDHWSPRKLYTVSMLWGCNGSPDVMALPEDVQWSPLAMFLIAFVLGPVAVGWMIVPIRKSKPARSDDSRCNSCGTRHGPEIVRICYFSNNGPIPFSSSL